MRLSLYFLSILLLIGCNQRDKATLNDDLKKVQNGVKRAIDTVKGRMSPDSETTGQQTSNTNVNSYDVTLDDYSIDIPDQIRAGAAQFKVSNHGKMDHNFEIMGNGVKRSFTPNLKPDETRVMELSLRPGTYDIICPLDGHKGKGMNAKLTVN